MSPYCLLITETQNFSKLSITIHRAHFNSTNLVTSSKIFLLYGEILLGRHFLNYRLLESPPWFLTTTSIPNSHNLISEDDRTLLCHWLDDVFERNSVLCFIFSLQKKLLVDPVINPRCGIFNLGPFQYDYWLDS